MEKEKIVVREDLNDIVKNIGFKTIKNSKYGDRHVCNVTLFNDEVIEFRDSDGLYDLFQSYVKCGIKDFIKSRELVEEVKTNDEGESESTYICVKYTLNDDSVYRLFVSRFNSNKIINNYYNLYKKLKKQTKTN